MNPETIKRDLILAATSRLSDFLKQPEESRSDRRSILTVIDPDVSAHGVKVVSYLPAWFCHTIDVTFDLVEPHEVDPVARNIRDMLVLAASFDSAQWNHLERTFYYWMNRAKPKPPAGSTTSSCVRFLCENLTTSWEGASSAFRVVKALKIAHAEVVASTVDAAKKVKYPSTG